MANGIDRNGARDAQYRERGADPVIAVRKAVARDNRLLAEIGAEAFSEAFGAHNKPEDMRLYLESSFHPQIQAAELADPSTVFLIAEAGSEPAGYARLREGRGPDGVGGERPIEIVRFYARARWIGRKVGAALMHASLAEARARACDTVWLGVWQENRRAIAFYEKWGFAKVGTASFRLGNDVQKDFVMARPVAHPQARS